MLTGRCHCGAVSYEARGEPIFHILCHCTDCRRAAGAPMVGWTMFPVEQVKIEGATRVYASSEHGRRHFCEACGTGLFYANDAAFPGMIDVQSATLDDPDAIPPTARVQIADRVSWMATAHDLPEFERYPG
ncbi:MAG: aldehyde-activating protein [Caulobacterales bacterium 68-7]|nr:GFA family protein [Caulobacterales bacterium]OJU12129.1 MAG: aldehyde-activating protein [Caulobacterales bacterium 68-7]